VVKIYIGALAFVMASGSTYAADCKAQGQAISISPKEIDEKRVKIFIKNMCECVIEVTMIVKGTQYIVVNTGANKWEALKTPFERKTYIDLDPSKKSNFVLYLYEHYRSANRIIGVKREYEYAFLEVRNKTTNVMQGSDFIDLVDGKCYTIKPKAKR
jgi:hypothetical protein